MLENYPAYLMFINDRIAKFFEMQKPYISCSKGCAKCCKNAQFPYSEIEIKYLLSGFLQLDEGTKAVIENNINKVLEQKKNFNGEEFFYDCPFLINDVCSVYHYRGLVCRTFGLLARGVDGRMKIPFCAYEGLNYSNVLDLEKREISKEKVEALNFPEKPAGFNISYTFLTDSDFEKTFNFKFGEKKSLIDWFIPESSDGVG